MKLFRRSELPVSRWINGAGRKADIAATPDWMLGFAWLDNDAPFSNLAGHDRTIMLLEGPGFALDFDPAAVPFQPPVIELRAPCVPRAFDGGWPARCRILGGPSVVLNVITRRSKFRHSEDVRNSVETLIEPQPNEQIFVVILAGAARFDSRNNFLDAGLHDAVQISARTLVTARPDTLLSLIRIGDF
jgi:environmental stress-induced protein Ves